MKEKEADYLPKFNPEATATWGKAYIHFYSDVTGLPGTSAGPWTVVRIWLNSYRHFTWIKKWEGEENGKRVFSGCRVAHFSFCPESVDSWHKILSAHKPFHVTGRSCFQRFCAYKRERAELTHKWAALLLVLSVSSTNVNRWLSLFTKHSYRVLSNQILSLCHLLPQHPLWKS